jgi:hypothetical protein
MMRWCLLPLFAAVACVPPYRPPSADQPHAVVKLRRTYETSAGVELFERVEIDEHVALEQASLSRLADAPRTDALLVHPVPSTVSFRSVYSHSEQRLVHESYQEPRTVYETESYDCSSGFGSSKSFRTCTRSVPRTSYETRYRDVWRTVQVTDADCSAAYRFSPRAGRVYLMQYTYHAQSVCSLSCFEQVPEEGGTFKNLPCPPAPPAAD